MEHLLGIFKEVLYLGATGSILILLILLVKKIFNKVLSSNWHYYIWILLLIRLLIPYYPESPVSIYNVFYIVGQQVKSPSNETSSSNQPSSFDDNSIDAVTTVKNDNTSIIPREVTNIIAKVNAKSIMNSAVNIMALIWISVVILFSLYTIAINMVFAINVRRSYTLLTDKRINHILAECKKRMKIKQQIPILTSKKVRTPSLYILFHPKILVSQSYMQNLSDAELKYIFLHELSHYKRKDIVINWIMALLQIVYFFHPLIWYAFYKIHEECEVSCDAAALRYVKEEEYQSYGNTIIKLIKLFSESNLIPTTAGIGKNKSNYKRRITMIKKHKKSKWTSTVLTLLLIISIGAIGLTGCNLIAKDDGNQDTEETTNSTEETTNSTDSTNSEDATQDTVTLAPENPDSDATKATESNDNQLPTEPEQDTTDSVDENQPLYYGEWVINLVQAYGVGTYSKEDAESLIGKSVKFSAGSATNFGDSVSDIDKESNNPDYTETVLSESDFVTNYRIPFEKLGIEGDTVTEINVTDSNGFVSTFFVKDENTLIIFGGGTYFELVRKG